jgi:hypothetical protein
VRTLRWVALAFALQLSLASTARGQDTARDAALKDFADGRTLLEKKKPADALPLLERSMASLPSPNTELMIGHCYRDLGRPARAAEAYRAAAARADAELAKGQDKYAQTAADAKRLASEVEATLGSLDVTVPAGASVVVARGADGDVVLTASRAVLVAPGSVTVKLVAPGRSDERAVTVTARASVAVAFELGSKEPARPGPQAGAAAATPAGGATFGGLAIAGGVIGGVGLAGLGMFAGFGASASSVYDELETCSPTCTVDDATELREQGKRDQLIANASLGVGLGLIATGALLLIVDGADGPEKPAAAGMPRLWLAVGSTAFHARATWEIE